MMEVSNHSTSEYDEESLIKYFFYRGYKYDEILLFLSKYYDIHMSRRTLMRQSQQMHFRRKSPDYDINVVRDSIIQLLDGPCKGQL